MKFYTGELKSILEKLPEDIEHKITKSAFRIGANLVKKEAKKRAPYDNKRRAGTHLRDAIVVKSYWSEKRLFKIGTMTKGKARAPHGHLLEFGTVKMPARPFLLPAFKESESKIKTKIIESLAKGVLKQSRRLAGLAKKKR